MPNSKNAVKYHGNCHCGAIEVDLSLTTPLDEVQLRACQCNFCTRQSSLGISDPRGSSQIRVNRADALSTYRFGHASAEFLICAKCGTYVAAVIGKSDEMRSVANARGLALSSLCKRPAAPSDFSSETQDERMSRRQRNWTPTIIHIAH